MSAYPIRPNERFAYDSIHTRADFVWPQSKRLAVYLGFNIEHFSFGDGLGACLGPVSPQPDVLNYMWREYGNRVGVWRCMDLFDELQLPTGAIVNTSLYEHCPEVMRALQSRGDEMIGHGYTNAQRQSDLTVEAEAAMIQTCQEVIRRESGHAPKGWLSPWLSESVSTPDLLAQLGFEYTLNYCHDDQPTRIQTQSEAAFWSIPYPQELNDIPMVIHRQLDMKDFALMIQDQLDVMLSQAYHPSRPQSLVMGLALHPYIVGQPYRLKYLRQALEYLLRFGSQIWFTTPGAIAESYAQSHPNGA